MFDLQQPEAKATISGVFEFKDKDGNVVGSTPFTMTVPVAQLLGEQEATDGKLGE